MTLFGMISTAASARYTDLALASFFAATPLGDNDRFILIDNDGDYPAPPGARPGFELVRNPTPLGFATNANQLMRRAAAAAADLVLLNNDIVFAPGWLAPLASSNDSLLLANSNQFSSFAEGELVLREFMELEEYGGRSAELA